MAKASLASNQERVATVVNRPGQRWHHETYQDKEPNN